MYIIYKGYASYIIVYNINIPTSLPGGSQATKDEEISAASGSRQKPGLARISETEVHTAPAGHDSQSPLAKLTSPRRHGRQIRLSSVLFSALIEFTLSSPSEKPTSHPLTSSDIISVDSEVNKGNNVSELSVTETFTNHRNSPRPKRQLMGKCTRPVARSVSPWKRIEEDTDPRRKAKDSSREES